jgi:RNA polymerase sigma-70 factor (ECF subfamily)
MAPDPPAELDPTTRERLQKAAAGDNAAWAALLAEHHDRLRRMVALRLDHRLQGRVDPSDVIQDTYLEAVGQLPDYLSDPRMPLFLWLRLLAGHRLGRVHRQHLGTQARDAGREVSLYRGPMPEASSAALAAHLLGKEARPSEVAMIAERKLRLQEALNSLDPLDREVLALRHFEQLSRAEVARELGISEAAAGKRYLRALERLRRHLEDDLSGLGGARA